MLGFAWLGMRDESDVQHLLASLVQHRGDRVRLLVGGVVAFWGLGFLSPKAVLVAKVAKA